MREASSQIDIFLDFFCYTVSFWRRRSPELLSLKRAISSLVYTTSFIIVYKIMNYLLYGNESEYWLLWPRHSWQTAAVIVPWGLGANEAIWQIELGFRVWILFSRCVLIFKLQVFLFKNRRLQSWWRLDMESIPCSRSMQVQRWSCPLRLAAKGVTKKSVWGDFVMQQSPRNYSKPHFYNGL